MKLLTGIDHADIMKRVCEESALTGHFMFMTVMSAGVAILGLLLSSPAVVIGAMLLSPLMGPILGFGFGLALFNFTDIRRAAITTFVGMAVAVLIAALIVLVSPVQTITPEIAARTRPNLFDLGVAILSGLAGTYAMIRGRHGAIVGVAIAVAVMPPLAVVGFGLATQNWPVLMGSAFLFFTNLIAIALSAAALARFYAFGRRLSPNQTWLQAVMIIAIIAAFAAPLAVALRQIARESVAARQAQTVLTGLFNGEARVSQVDMDFHGTPVRLTATIFSPAYQPNAEAEAGARMSAFLGEPVAVHLDQVRVGGGEADAAQLAAARTGDTRDTADALIQRLALLAGADANEVLVDRQRRVARVRAAPLPGASFDTYRALEERARAADEGWTIILVPPQLALPELADTSSADAEANLPRLQSIAWAAQRLDLPVELSGRGAAEAAALLTEAGVTASVAGENGTPTLRWFVPGN